MIKEKKYSNQNQMLNIMVTKKENKYYVADSGYYTNQILEYLKDNGFVAIIKEK